MRRADRRTPSERNPTAPPGSSTAYTTAQREQLQRGLRILARMIVRAHLRRQASRPGAAPGMSAEDWAGDEACQPTDES